MLLEKIKTDMWVAKKSGEKITASLLNTLYAEAARVGKDDGQRETTDAETIAVVKKFLKNNAETLELVKSDSIATALYLSEKQILEKYVPKQLDKEELAKIIADLKSQGLDMGSIMKTLKQNYTGLYDGKLASEIVKSL